MFKNKIIITLVSIVSLLTIFYSARAITMTSDEFLKIVGNNLSGEDFLGLAVYTVSQGGTGTATAPTNGQLLIGNSSGTYDVNTLTAGTNVTISEGDGSITINSTGGGSGSGTVSTSTIPTVGNLAYWTSNSFPSLLGDVATSSLTASAPISLSNPISVIGDSASVLSCASASGSQAGCLASADWTTFNNKWDAIGDISLDKGHFIVGDDSGTAQATSSIFMSSTGNVGIGTVNPAWPLQIAKSGTLVVSASSTDATTNTQAQFQSITDASTMFFTTHAAARTATAYGITLGGWGELSVNNNFGTNKGMIIGSRTNTPIVFGTNALERLRINNTGMIGIGTTTPWGLLSLTNTSATVPSFVVEDSTSPDATPFIIDKDGNVGIGTAIPANQLHVHSISTGGDDLIQMTNADTGITTTDGFIIGIGGTETAYLWNYENTNLRFAVNNAEKMTLQSDGNLGIGDTSPLSLLTVGNGDLFQINSSGAIVAITGLSGATGSYDFGGATSIEIVNGSAPTVDAIGEIALDTTDNQLLIATSTNASFPAVIPLKGKIRFKVASTTEPFFSGFTTGKLIGLPPDSDGYTVTHITCSVWGGTSIVVNVTDGANDSNTATCGTATSTVAFTSNNTFTANEGASVETGTVTGAPNALYVNLTTQTTRE